MVEGGKMKKARNDVRRRRIELLLGVICIIIGVLIYSTGKKSWQQDLAELEGKSYPHLSYKEWIAIHESEYTSSSDAQDAYHNYEAEYYTPEYREAQKKQTLYSVGEIVFFLIGAICLFRQIYLFRQYCLKR